MAEKDRNEHGAEAPHGAFMKPKKKLSLEKYFDFLASRDPNVLTVTDLRDILSIHGFKKLKKAKQQLVEAVSTMKLMDFSRSTLGECIHPAPMTLNEVIKDLSQLNWQTCPVVSVISISSTQYNNFSSSNPESSIDPSSLESGKKNTKPRHASKRKGCGLRGTSISAGGASSGDQKADCEMTLIGTSCFSSSRAEENLNAKRKVKLLKSLIDGSSEGLPKPSLNLETLHDI